MLQTTVLNWGPPVNPASGRYKPTSDRGRQLQRADVPGVPRRLLALLACVFLAAGGFLWWRGGHSPERTAVTGAADTTDVLLIPGHGGSTDGVAALGVSLAEAGFSTSVVDIGNGSQNLNLYAEQVAAQARDAGQVALVGYSQGGLIARAAAALAPASIARVVTIATPHGGTQLAELGSRFVPGACDASCKDMVPASQFLAGLPFASDETRWLSVFTSQDEVVRPPGSAVLDGATNIDLAEACPDIAVDHGGTVTSPVVAQLVASLLQSGSPGFPVCR